MTHLNCTPGPVVWATAEGTGQGVALRPRVHTEVLNVGDFKAT